MHRHGTTARTGVPAGNRPVDPADGPTASRPLRTAARALLLLHLVLLTWLALRPLPVSWTNPANLTPLASVRQAFAVGGLHGAGQIASGILPLAPLGALLPLAAGRLRARWLPSFLRTTGASALLATALEIVEGWAPGHVLNVDDILLGTVGAAVCHLAVVPAVRAVLGRDRAGTAPAQPAGHAGAAPAVRRASRLSPS